MNDFPPLVPAKGATRTAALRFLGLKPEAADARAHAVIRRWMEQDDPRFEQYWDRFVEPFESITRERIKVSPERYRRIVNWQRDPLYGLVPYEAVYPGGDPEQIDDDDVREPAPITINQMADRIAEHFGIAEHTAKLSGVLARLWRAERTDEPVSVIAAITGAAPKDPAVRRELKNLLRRSATRGPGAPRGARLRRQPDPTLIAAIREDARRIRKALPDSRYVADRHEEAVCKLLSADRSPMLQRRIAKLFARKHLTPRTVLIFVLACRHNLSEPLVKSILANHYIPKE